MRRSIRRQLPPIHAARVAVLLLGAACAAAGPDGEGAVGGPAPAFELMTLEDGTLSLDQLAGKVVLVDFWATWCQPCHIQSAILKELYPEVQPRGVEFVAISVGEDRTTVEAFVNDRPFPYPVALDPDASYADSVGIYGFPTLMIVDREGQMAFLQAGITRAEALREILYELTAQQG